MLPLPGLCAGVVAPRSRAAAAASASAICAAVGFVRAIWLPLAHDHRHDRQGSFSRLHAKHSTVCGPYAAPRLACRWFQRLRASLKEGEGLFLLHVSPAPRGRRDDSCQDGAIKTGFTGSPSICFAIPVEDETLIRVLGDGIVDDAKRHQKLGRPRVSSR